MVRCKQWLTRKTRLQTLWGHVSYKEQDVYDVDGWNSLILKRGEGCFMLKTILFHAFFVVCDCYLFSYSRRYFSLIGWGDRIHRLHLCRVVRPPPKRVSCGQVGRGSRIHRLHLCRVVRPPPKRVSSGQVGRGSRIHRLHLCRVVRHPLNECPVAKSAWAVEYTDCISAGVKTSPQTSVLYMTLNCIWWWGSISEVLGNVK